MDFILDMAVTFWQWTVVISLILIGFIASIFDGQGEDRVGFYYTDMPQMSPIKIETADKGFWKAIWMWLVGVRHWEITKDFYFSLKGEEYVIPQGFEFDGASVPKFLAMWLSPTGVLLMGGLIHDYGYKYGTLLRSDRTTIGDKSQKWMDTLFRDICIQQNGFKLLNYLAYWALRLGGFVAWNGHRKHEPKN
tara:strand:- start:3763 stop:4338 length:576 start_codon:yes stop_codon:yes gene_type:complete